MSAIETESSLSLVEIEGRGRALVASKPLKAGQIILQDSPILVYSALPLIQAQSQFSALYCNNCFKVIPSVAHATLCPSCSQQHLFCCPNCLAAATASSHSPWVCQALTRLRDWHSLVSQPLDIQVQARYLVAAVNLSLISPSQFQLLLSLQGQSSPSDAHTAQFLHSFLSSFFPSSLSTTVELISALLANDKMNAFGLMEHFSGQKDGQRSVRAYGIYPRASFFNHDCLPNACRFDYVDSAPERNTDIIVRMIHDVPQGREICLSYFPVNLNYSTRQQRLLEDYGFICQCDRCKVEANWSDNEADGADDNEIEEVMDEDIEEEMSASDADHVADDADTDFPHAYFFLRYMCSQENCCGTLAPLPPSIGSPSNVMECNVCGTLKNDEDMNADAGQSSMEDRCESSHAFKFSSNLFLYVTRFLYLTICVNCSSSINLWVRVT